MKVIRLSLDLNTGRKIISRKEYPLHHEIICNLNAVYTVQSNLRKRATFCQRQNCLLYTGNCLIKCQSEDLLCRKFFFSVRFTTKPISKEDLDVCLTYFFMLHYTKIYLEINLLLLFIFLND